MMRMSSSICKHSNKSCGDNLIVTHSVLTIQLTFDRHPAALEDMSIDHRSGFPPRYTHNLLRQDGNIIEAAYGKG
jgi:hypothetical protein